MFLCKVLETQKKTRQCFFLIRAEPVSKGFSAGVNLRIKIGYRRAEQKCRRRPSRSLEFRSWVPEGYINRR